MTIKEDRVRAKYEEAIKDPDEHVEFRRLYLSLWPTSGRGRWLDMARWDACSVPTVTPPDNATLYIGLDLSLGDDLCAAAFIWVAPDRCHVDGHFWITRDKAEFYRRKDGVPYHEWAAAGDIELVDEPVISDDVHNRIAKYVIHRAGKHKVHAVCYDQAHAHATVAALEAAGLTCLSLRQGYTISPGCRALESRLKDRSLVIASNRVSRFCAENVEVKDDDRGNIWPVKPSAKGRYAGKRGAKIDFITALTTAMTEARKHSFPAVRKFWKGTVCTV